MKKSQIYRLAQMAVVNSLCIPAVDKLEVLRELMDKESLAEYVEKQEEKEIPNEAVQ